MQEYMLTYMLAYMLVYLVVYQSQGVSTERDIWSLCVLLAGDCWAWRLLARRRRRRRPHRRQLRVVHYYGRVHV